MIVEKSRQYGTTNEKTYSGHRREYELFLCAGAQKKYELFGEKQGRGIGEVALAPLLGQLPIDPELARLCDNGDIEHYTNESVANLGKALLAALETKTGPNNTGFPLSGQERERESYSLKRWRLRYH